MRPRERRETSEQDLFRSRLDQIIDMKHALVKLSRAIDWGFLEQTFGAVYTDKPGQPPLPTRLMAGLAILKHTYDPSDEALCDRWVENPYFQYFCGEAFFQHRRLQATGDASANGLAIDAERAGDRRDRQSLSMKIKNHDDFPKLNHRSAPSFSAERDWVIDSPPIPRARPGDGRHDQLGNFQTALLGRITPASTTDQQIDDAIAAIKQLIAERQAGMIDVTPTTSSGETPETEADSANPLK